MKKQEFQVMALPATALLMLFIFAVSAGTSVTASSSTSELGISLGSLMIFGFLVNCCGATQDVAVDGMAIDILPMDERGRANAFMGFGQVMGFSTFGALTGWILAAHSLAAGALVAAVAVSTVLVFVILCRERQGEKRFPWSEGSSAGESVTPPVIATMFKDLLRSLLLPQGLVLAAVALLLRAAAGLFIVIVPVVAVQELGYSGAQYSATYAFIRATGTFKSKLPSL